MTKTEKQLIKKSNPQYKEIDKLCFLSKNLYNKANYIVRQEFITNRKWLQYYDINKLLKESNDIDYRSLPVASSQQILILLERNWKSFFKSIKSWSKTQSKTQSKFNGKPGLPKYKDKTKGRNLLVFTNQQCKLKNGYITFPKKTGFKPIKTNIKNFQNIRIIPCSNKTYSLEIIYKTKVKEKVANENKISIDIGIDNLMTLTSNVKDFTPVIINGRPLKSINQYYNKKKAKLQSELQLQFPKKYSSNKLESLTIKRNNKVKDYIHKATRMVTNICIENNISDVVIGLNKNWKKEVNIGKVNNQKFVYIPHSKMLEYLKYKLNEEGITLIQREESYTSKCSFLDNEDICKQENYLGKRIHRGLFVSKTGRLINADVNASYNILKKEFGEITVINKGLRLSPIRLNL